MNKYLTKFQQWILRKICKELVKQDYNHEQKIVAYMAIMREEAEKQFRKDSKWAIDRLLRDCLAKSF